MMARLSAHIALATASSVMHPQASAGCRGWWCRGEVESASPEKQLSRGSSGFYVGRDGRTVQWPGNPPGSTTFGCTEQHGCVASDRC